MEIWDDAADRTRLHDHAAMTIRYELQLPDYSQAFIQRLVSIAREIFGHADEDYVKWRLASMPDVSVFYALSRNEMVGFKAGYAMTKSKYYSWLGGVVSEHRGQGIASALMAKQHEWLSARSYRMVETAVNQENQEMARVNLRHGFAICGIRTEPHRVQVIYLKQLQ